MHSAPAVTHPTGRTPQLALLLALVAALGLVGAIGVAGWGGGRPLGAGPAAALAAAWALALAGLWRFWRAQRSRRLAWDGAQWRLQGEGVASAPEGPALDVQPRLDLQGMLLLHALDPASGRRTWLWAQRGADAGRWHLLRCAVWALPPRPGDAPLARPDQAARAP